ncbi:hypothetical protein [Gemmatimonas aurantiaca]|nr:hypothetical protein [Gemmatimonas aurantiaca]
MSAMAAAGAASLVVFDGSGGAFQPLIWTTAAHAITTAFCAAAFKRGTRSAVGRALTGFLASASAVVVVVALTFHPGIRYWIFSAAALGFWAALAFWLTRQFDEPGTDREPAISARTDPPAELPPPQPQQPPMVRPVVHDAPSR